MSEKNEIQIQQPAELIMAAVKSDTDLDKLEKLLELQMKWEGNEAKKAYFKAIASFKEEAPIVTKDKENKQYGSMYTTLGNLINTVNPILSKHGLSASWDIEQNGVIKVVCKLTHELGHSEIASMQADADKSGSKSAIQQLKSTITYLKSVTFESICGLASSNANYDDDGQSAGVEIIEDKQLHKLRDFLISLDKDETKFCAFLKVDKLENLPKSQYQQAIAALEASKKKKEAK